MSSLNGKRPQRSWRSIEELEQTPEFREYLEHEFPEQAEGAADPVSRRTFVQLMGASFALAGVAGCRWEKEDIVPLSRKPEGHVPGVPSHFATAMELGGAAAGLLVTAFDGRPIKIEGNPDHPFTGGRSTAFAQASILHLYDPDRSERVIRRVGAAKIPVSWDDFYEFVEHLPGTTQFRILSEATSSPTVARLRDAAVRRFSTAQWHEWEPLSHDSERAGTKEVFGVPMRVLPMLDQANVVLALDSDMLTTHPASLRHARDLIRRRRPEEGQVSRLYAVESGYSSTGGLADHRLPLRSELIYPFLLALGAKLSGGPQQNAAFLAEPKVQAFLDAVAEDMKSDRSRSVIVVGPSQPPVVHALAAVLNEAAAGVAVSYVPAPDPERQSHAESIRQLVNDMRQGEVDLLLILGGNPVYDAPSDLGFAQALGKVRDSIHLSPYVDETSTLCTWHLPRAHFLEAWGDARAWDGTVTVQQPIIQPLRRGGSPIQILAAFTRQRPGSGEDHVRDTHGQSDAEWRKILHDGHLPGSQLPRVQPQAKDPQLPPLTPTQAKGTQIGNGELEVVFTPSSHCYDGRFANNAWLQETPDFMTKLVWDNAALLAPSTAKALGVGNGDMIEIKIGNRRIAVAAYTMPGQAPGSIALAVGHGRSRAGRVGGMAESTYVWKDDEWIEALSADTPGFDVYPLRTSDSLYIATGAHVTPLGETYDLTTTQDHWAIDQRGRDQIELTLPQLARWATVEQYKDPQFEKRNHPHGPPLKSMWDNHPELTAQTGGHRWAMATDLAACIGCNSCMLACQSENNVPVVGKREVRRTREMHWIRVDRYFQGEPDDPRVLFQPVTCQQCESAPCEQVCPVGATIHSDEGLNDMVYNRCVGTRYCANNCPYKVRRFNYLSWHHKFEFTDPDNPKNAIRKLLFNPEVTVRSRGVMEKCTFCVQRIESAKIRANNENRPIRDGEFTTACAQACPTDAIVFGDLSDPNSRVSKLHKDRRRYALLAELNTSPRNVYLTRILNPNNKLAGESHNEHGSH